MNNEIRSCFDNGDVKKVSLNDLRISAESAPVKFEPVYFRQSIPVGIKVADGAKRPDYASSDDSGADLYILEDVYIAPGARGLKIRTGIKLDLPAGFEVQVRPKSGVSTNTTLRVILGTVDAGYKGEIAIMVDNLSDEVIYVSKHKAIAQMVLQSVPMMKFEDRDEFSQSKRGENGFGSTGRGI